MFTEPLEGINGLLFRRVFENNFNKYKSTAFSFFTIAHLLALSTLAYAAFLHLQYSIKLCRFSFNAAKSKKANLKTAAAVLGAAVFTIMAPIYALILGVLFSYAAVPVCAAKQRDWTAFALATASIIFAAAMAAAMHLRAAVSPATQELLLLASMSLALASMLRLKCGNDGGNDGGKNASRLLAFSPVLLCAAALLALRIYIAHLESRADEAAAELYKSAGFEITFDDLVAAHTNGIPMTSEPFASIFHGTNRLSSIPSPMDWRKDHASCNATSNLPPWKISDEERAAFDAYFASNAAAIELLDELTLRPDARPAGAYEKPDDLFSGTHLFTWGRLYSKRIAHAQGDGAAQRIIADARRMRNLALWTESQPRHLLNAAHAAAMRNMRFASLCAALPGLPDDALLELRAECRHDRVEPEKIYALSMMHETLCNIRMNDEFIKQANGQPNAFPKNAPLFAEAPLLSGSPFSRFCIAWLLHEKITFLRHAQAIFERSSAPLQEGATRFGHMAKSAADDRLIFRTPIHFIFLPAKTSACASAFRLAENQALFDAAIAVELHRRKHGALPGTLAALVPEFLDAEPASIFDAEPFAYDRGFIEEFQPRSEPSASKLLYTFNGFRISGSTYDNNSSRIRRDSMSVPLPLSAPPAPPDSAR